MGGRVGAMVLRYLLTYRRSRMRSFELFFWPAMDLLVWGYVTTYLEGLVSSSAVSFLLGGMLLWDVFFRAQQAVSVGVLQEMWVGNLLNIFVSPLSMRQFLAATAIMGVIRAGITAIIIAALASLLYAFNILSLSWSLVPLLTLLLVFGWSMGVFAMAIILRYGEAAENLAWAIPFMLQPFCAVFYPAATLPHWLQGVAYAMPCTYVFEGMREVIRGAGFNWELFAYASVLSAVYLILALWFFGYILRLVRDKGYLTRGVRT